MCRGNRTSGHLGITKRLARSDNVITGRDYKGMCTRTRRTNPVPKRRTRRKQVVVSVLSMERTATDILCELPDKTDLRNRHNYSHRVGLFYKMAFALPNMEVETIARTIMENHSDKVASSKAKYVRLPGITNIRTTRALIFRNRMVWSSASNSTPIS